MKLYEKIIIIINALMTVWYSMIVLAGYKEIADGIGSLFGSLLFLFLFPYFIAYIISKFSKAENKKLFIWKLFIKIYPVVLILATLGIAQR